MRLFFVVLLVLGALVVNYKSQLRAWVGLPSDAGASTFASAGSTVPSYGVVMYATPTCGVCKQARRYFARKGVMYEERDITISDTYRAEYNARNGRGVPLFVIDGKTYRGFNSQLMDQRLAQR